MIFTLTIPVTAFLSGKPEEVIKQYVLDHILKPSYDLGYAISLRSVKVSEEAISRDYIVKVDYFYKKHEEIKEIEERLEIGL